jgi:hypothetical protein
MVGEWLTILRALYFSDNFEKRSSKFGKQFIDVLELLDWLCFKYHASVIWWWHTRFRLVNFMQFNLEKGSVDNGLFWQTWQWVSKKYKKFLKIENNL